ncbi:Acyl-CoA synthetase (AMP-forming)/AMP-acid ligase II [Sulfitobacter brevis]|uniref:Acyl-CoA synthetase (AMP-forming)/AMP-acid ligase II n=1 Tax=Sulfitobacter brevis TaxID=74348 RepID=A0A1I1UUU8_9RHOB|nr:class I adenylate-forming enzyme family protein [Sulfitobacter brevis]SFD74449.1 Acyl-CoA synthetase (AMP-forming)/AMP-acid ligase II [Sulfitobacter brevis]
MLPPCPAPFNMARHVLTRGAMTPQKTALSVVGAQGAEDWSYAQLIAAVRGTATGLLQRGLVPGDIVLMRLGNTTDFPLAYLGALAAGLVPAPTAAALSAPEVAKLIEVLAPKAVLHDPQVPCPEGVATIDLSELRMMHALAPAPWHMGDPDRLGYVIFTSGTSGNPMAVMHAHRAIWARQMMFEGWYGLTGEDRLLHAGAFNWTYTLGTGLMDPWTMGATALIPAVGTAAADLPALIAQHKATIFAAAPGVYRQMVKDGKHLEMPALRHGLSAGEKLAPATQAQWEHATGTRTFEAFGMSECSTFISGAPSRPAAAGSLGAPQPGRNVAILGAAGPVAAGTTGVIAVRRDDPGLMLGYLGAPEQTAARFQGDWFLTGDIGVADAEGFITYQGRADDMMNAGGFRVSPLEVEAVMGQAPGVTGIGVTEVAVKTGVTVIAAFYTAAAALDATALERYAQDNLARYKQPRLYIHVPDLPQSANGKLQRRRLKAAYEENNHV